MTLRISELFEENVKPLISHFKSAKKRSDRDSPTKKKAARPTRNNGAGPSTSNDNQNSGDSDDDDHGPDQGRRNGRSRRTHAQSNGVSSSSHLRDSQPETNKRSRRQPRKSSADESHSPDSSSDDSSDNSDESSGIPLSELGKPFGKAAKKSKKRAKKPKRGAVSSSSPKKSSRNAKRLKMQSEEEPEDDHTEDGSESKSRSSSQPKSSRRSSRQQPKSRRIQSSSDDEQVERKTLPSDKGKRISRRPKRYESDQSFHVENNAKKTADSDSDKPRATRESAKKKFIEWALTSDDDNEDDEDFNQKPQTSSQALRAAAKRAVRKKALASESEHSEDKKSKPAPSRRSTRTQRVSQSQSQSQDDESEESDQQNKPSTSTNVRNSSRVNGQPSHSQAPIPPRQTRSSQGQPSSRSTSNNDHNYGEPGPSSSASVPPRETRSTILSRHQRNADELDRSGLEDSSIGSSAQNSAARLLRLRSANMRTVPTSNFEVLNGIRRTMRARVMHNYFEDENDNDNDETSRLQQPLHQSSSRLRMVPRQVPPNDPSDDSDSYSEEDKTPLKLMASSSSKKAHEHNTRNGTAVNRVKRNLYSEEEEVRIGELQSLSGINQSFLLRPDHQTVELEARSVHSTTKVKIAMRRKSCEDLVASSKDEFSHNPASTNKAATMGNQASAVAAEFAKPASRSTCKNE